MDQLQVVSLPHTDDLWALLEALPASMTGEIIGNSLYMMPRPRYRHAEAIFSLGEKIRSIYQYRGNGGGGNGREYWRILAEPGIELPDAREVSPDIAGWRMSTMPTLPPPDEPIRTVPDWVCEVLSPSSVRYDTGVKREFYARVGVSWMWNVDPSVKTVMVFELEHGEWVTRECACGDKFVQLPPFEHAEIPLGEIWNP